MILASKYHPSEWVYFCITQDRQLLQHGLIERKHIEHLQEQLLEGYALEYGTLH